MKVKNGVHTPSTTRRTRTSIKQRTLIGISTYPRNWLHHSNLVTIRHIPARAHNDVVPGFNRVECLDPVVGLGCPCHSIEGGEGSIRFRLGQCAGLPTSQCAFDLETILAVCALSKPLLTATRVSPRAPIGCCLNSSRLSSFLTEIARWV